MESLNFVRGTLPCLRGEVIAEQIPRAGLLRRSQALVGKNDATLLQGAAKKQRLIVIIK